MNIQGRIEKLEKKLNVDDSKILPLVIFADTNDTEETINQKANDRLASDMKISYAAAEEKYNRLEIEPVVFMFNSPKT